MTNYEVSKQILYIMIHVGMITLWITEFIRTGNTNFLGLAALWYFLGSFAYMNNPTGDGTP